MFEAAIRDKVYVVDVGSKACCVSILHLVLFGFAFTQALVSVSPHRQHSCAHSVIFSLRSGQLHG